MGNESYKLVANAVFDKILNFLDNTKIEDYNLQAKAHNSLQTRAHKYVGRRPKRIIEISSDDRSLLIMDVASHQVDEIKKSYRNADVYVDEAEREEFVLNGYK